MEDLRDPIETARARSAADEFQYCLSTMEGALQSALTAFAGYHAADGKVSREQWAKWFEGDTPSQEYIDGYNAGVESVLGAAKMFIEDMR